MTCKSCAFLFPGHISEEPEWGFCVKAQAVHYCAAGGPCAPPVNAWLMHTGLSLSQEFARESRRVAWSQPLVNTLPGRRTDPLLVLTLSQRTKIIVPLHDLVVAGYAQHRVLFWLSLIQKGLIDLREAKGKVWGLGHSLGRYWIASICVGVTE